MKKSILLKRRQVLQSALAGGATLGLSPFLLHSAYSASAGGPEELSWQALDNNLALITGAGGNVLASRGADGIMLVDGGAEEHSGALLSLLESQWGGEPELLFNTHCHRDQIGSNEGLGKKGRSIIAHENTRLWLTTEIISKWEDRVYPPMPEEAWPNQTFYDGEKQLTFNENIEYGYLPQGHTDGDIYVFLPERNILMAGGVVAPAAYPVLDYSTNGWIGGMINSLELLLAKVDSETRIIASEGEVVNRAFLEQQLAMCNTIIGQIGEQYYQGKGLEEFLANKPSEAFDERWGNPDLFLRTAWDGAWGHVTELRRFGR